MKKIMAIAIASAFATPVFAGVAVSGSVSARVGADVRGGEFVEGYKNFNSVDGNYVLFISGTTNVGKGYSAGFTCATVSTTVDGAAAAYDDVSLPVKHAWAQFFSGQENFAGNAVKGGFASYGNNLGDSNGPFCNDEVKGYITTPYGTVAVGNIINPLRNLYDATTVDPVYGNERVYYNIADFRGNALRYGHSIGDFSFDLQVNLNSSSQQKEGDPSGTAVYTGFAAYDFGGGTMIGAGFGLGNGGTPGNKYVDPTSALQFKNAFGLTGKTGFGGLGLAYTFMTAANEAKGPTDSASTYFKNTDNMIKATYNLGSWNFVGIGSFETSKFDFTKLSAWGANYTWAAGDAMGQSFTKLNIDRTRFDLWAIYSLGGGVQPYARIDYIQKKYTSEDGPTSGSSVKTSSTKFETGFMVSF